MKLSEIADRYGIPETKVKTLMQPGAWHCHRQCGMTRFSPDDQSDIKQKWQKYDGTDPHRYTPRWIEIAMKNGLADMDHEAVERGAEASRSLRSLERRGQSDAAQFRTPRTFGNSSTSIYSRGTRSGHAASLLRGSNPSFGCAFRWMRLPSNAATQHGQVSLIANRHLCCARPL